MLKPVRFAVTGLLLTLSLPACVTRTEVITVPAAPTPAPAPKPRPKIAPHSAPVAEKKKAPAPSPWATEAVSASDDNGR